MVDKDHPSGHQTNPGSLPESFAFGMCRPGSATISARATAGQASEIANVRRVGEVYLDFTVILYPRGRYFDIVT